MTPTLEEQARDLAVEAEGLCYNDGWFDKGEFASCVLAALGKAHAEGARQALEEAADQIGQFTYAQWTAAEIEAWLRARAAQPEDGR